MFAVNGYYNGTNIVLEQDVALAEGQRVLVVLETPVNRKRQIINLNQYVTTTERGKNVDSYMEEMRGNDRI